MGFKIGDTVIHPTFGICEIIKTEEKTINGHFTNCYVMSSSNMTIWVPIDESEQCSLRTPTAPDEFIKTLPILTSPNEKLDDDRLLRKQHLTDQLQDGQLASICRVVRDLNGYKRGSKLNDQEKSIFDRAKRSLLTEWTYSLGIPQQQAHLAMETMLQG